MLATMLTIPPALPGQGWSVVFGPLAGLAAFAVLAVFVFLVVGAIVELGNPHPASEAGPASPDRAGHLWPDDERMVA